MSLAVSIPFDAYYFKFSKLLKFKKFNPSPSPHPSPLQPPSLSLVAQPLPNLCSTNQIIYLPNLIAHHIDPMALKFHDPHESSNLKIVTHIQG